jgi:hypothetical protein
MATARQSIPFVVGPQVVHAPEVVSQSEISLEINSLPAQAEGKE